MEALLLHLFFAGLVITSFTSEASAQPSKAKKLLVVTPLGERHHFRLPVAERVKRFVGFTVGASASKALTASATRKQAFVEFLW